MTAALPTFFIVAAGLLLFVSLVAVYQSLRAVLSNMSGAGLEEDGSVKRSELLDRRRALLESLRDLRQDHDTKKMDDEDFAQLEAALRDEIREVLQAIDARVDAKRDAIEARIRGEAK
jgi:secreted Zn-dependent insulinase-like peptidase